MNLIESALSLSLPPDYKQFVATHGEHGFEYFFRVDLWRFLSPEKATERTRALRESKAIGEHDFAFASNQEGQSLFYKHENGALSPKIYHLDEENDWMFYACSIAEFENFEKLEQLTNGISPRKFVDQDLSGIMDYPGSLYYYAMALLVSSYNDQANAEQKAAKALELFFLAAEQEHPGAANQIASHYYFAEEPDVDKVIEWREKAIAWGSVEDIYELADLLVDERPEEIDQAIALLEGLLDTYWYKSRTSLKLSRIYMKGEGGRLDYEKGIKYAEMCASLDNYNGLSDLAFFYFKGMGVEKNLAKALELLKQAEKLAKDKGIGGPFEDNIRMVEKELGKGN